MKKKWINPKYRYDVGVFQIPHHGANNYLDGNLVSRYPNVQHWVINFGLGNTHKHPHQSIVDAILNNKLKGHIFCNTQANQFYYGCRII
jgi:beta-lactamase superfamily II metal-dependent hydrolase